MEIEEKLELNKKIRKYDGDNPFLLSTKRQLINSKYLQKVVFGKKSFKILSDKQYQVAKELL